MEHRPWSAVEVTNGLAKQGKLTIRPVRGGVMLYLPEDTPTQSTAADDVLKKMGL